MTPTPPQPASVVAVIPARMASTRFPGKPLACETGRPMIQHVCERAARATLVDRVLVATDDQRIIDAVRAFGGEAILTRSDHPNGTSRIAEVAGGLDCAIVVNVQGDEPMIDPDTIDLAVRALLESEEVPMSTVACAFGPEEDPGDPNLVKVVHDATGRAVDFSRSPLAEAGSDGNSPLLRHVGLYAYRREFLPVFAGLASTEREVAERLEQLRALDHGHPIAVTPCPRAHHGIDTPEQYARFVREFNELSD
ncbi:MAG: 3-deoxy-manno-octulosonate cytidylyltransferase [Planctomycetota bacterium]|nr:3-deoxy-manno-octulosonate cytidylyltransferase [Planctomycetota bacterium]